MKRVRCTIVNVCSTLRVTGDYLRDRSLEESNHDLRLRSVITIKYLSQNPSIPKHVYQPPHPQPIEYVFSQKLEFVCLTEPEGLGAHPHPNQRYRFLEGDRQLRDNQGKEEEVPQKILCTS